MFKLSAMLTKRNCLAIMGVGFALVTNLEAETLFDGFKFGTSCKEMQSVGWYYFFPMSKYLLGLDFNYPDPYETY